MYRFGAGIHRKILLFTLFGLFWLPAQAAAQGYINKGESIVRLKVKGQYEQIMRLIKNEFVREGYILINDWGEQITFKRIHRDYARIYPGERMWEYLTVEIDMKIFHLYTLECFYRVAESDGGVSMRFDKEEKKLLKKEYKKILKRIKKELKK